MSRNGSGVYSVPNTFVAGTTITASDHNENWDDIEAEITNSVAADGQTSMTGALKAANGTEAAPSVTFASDTDTGLWRIGANNLGIGAGGTKIIDITASGATFAGTTTFSSGLGTTSIADDAITFAKLLNATAGSVLIGATAAGNFQEIVLSTGLSLSGSNLIATAQLGRGQIDGCILSNGTDATNDINIAAGVCRDSTNAVNITVAAMTGKQLDANWAPGAAAGMRNSAVGIANGTYHIYTVSKADGTQDIYAHTSTTVATVITALQAESGGANYLYARRIGSILREGGSIVGFIQVGDAFHRKAAVKSVNGGNISSTAASHTIGVPSGLRVNAEVSGLLNTNVTGLVLYLFCPDIDDPTVTATSGPSSAMNVTANGEGITRQLVLTNTSAQINSKTSSGNPTMDLYVHGWVDLRGKDS